MARPEDFGANSGAVEQDDASKGANAQFHDLVYRQPGNSVGGGLKDGWKDEPFICHAWDLSRKHDGGHGGGGFGGGFGGRFGEHQSAEDALGQLYVQLAREGKLDKGTLRALDKIGDELDGDRHFMHGGHGHPYHRGGGDKIQLMADMETYGNGIGQQGYDATMQRLQNANETGLGSQDVDGAAVPQEGVNSDGSMVAPYGANTDGSMVAPNGANTDGSMVAPNGANTDGSMVAPTGVTGDGSMVAPNGVTGDGTSATSMAPDVQQLTALWAASHGANPADAAAFQQVTPGADGTSSTVGPYGLDANLIGSWFSQMQSQTGSLDSNALQQLAATKGLSPETTAAISSPEFAQFMQQWAQGQAPAADQIAKFLPQDLQNAIAGDLAGGMANALAASGQQVTPGALLASLELRKPLTATDLQDPNIASYVQQVDQAVAQAQAGATTDGTTTTTMGADGTVTTGLDGGTAFGTTTTGGTSFDTSGVTVTGGDGTTTTTGTDGAAPFTITTGDGSASTILGGDTGPITIAQDPNADAAPMPAE